MNRIKTAQIIGKAIRLFSRKAYYDFLLSIFSSPPKVKNKPADSLVTFDSTTIKLQGYAKTTSFTLYKKMASRQVILFAHGWGGSMQNFKYFFQPALDRNMSIIGFDAPAHGASLGKRTHILEFKDTIKYCLNQVKDFEHVIVVAHSLGAAAATLAIMESPEVKVDQLFALAAPADLRKIFDDYVATMNVSSKDVKKIPAYVKQKIQLDFEENNWKNKPIPDHLAHVMLLHGKNDEVIKTEEILTLAKAWRLDEINDVRLLDQVGHYNILKSPKAIEEVFSKVN